MHKNYTLFLSMLLSIYGSKNKMSVGRKLNITIKLTLSVPKFFVAHTIKACFMKINQKRCQVFSRNSFIRRKLQNYGKHTLVPYIILANLREQGVILLRRTCEKTAGYTTSSTKKKFKLPKNYDFKEHSKQEKV